MQPYDHHGSQPAQVLNWTNQVASLFVLGIIALIVLIRVSTTARRFTQMAWYWVRFRELWSVAERSLNSGSTHHRFHFP